MALITKLVIFLFLLMGLPAFAQVFSCSTFVTTNTSCGVGGAISGSGGAFKVVGSTNGATPSVTGGKVIIANAGVSHFALSMMYQTAVDIRAFTTTFQFIPNNQNLAFTINNCANNGATGLGTCGGFALANFSAGASCEGGFYQGYSGNSLPYNIFAMMFDEYGFLSGGSFTYSGVQLYQQNQSPCNPDSGGTFEPYWSTTKFSTSPVPFNSPSNAQGTTTGDTYSATVSYDGSNFNLCLYDVTAANGSCSSSTSGTGTFYQNTWANVSIPSQINSTTGYIGFTGSSGLASTGNLTLSNWTYTVNAASASPGSTVTSAGSPTAVNPSFSPVAGTYGSTQSVAITAAGSSNICYTLGAAGLTILPIANQLGGCAVGTLYTGAVSVASTKTLYAVAGLNGTGTSSGVVQGVYSIVSPAAAPTFSPVAGSYTGTQNVALSTTSSGAVICYNTVGAPATDGATGCATGTKYVGTAVSVPSSQTLYAVAGGTGYADSSVTNAAYTITGPAATPTFSPSTGTYSGPQSVTITAASGSVICYNTTGAPATNGGTGCATGTKYTGPVSVLASGNLYAVAGGTGFTDSTVGAAVYTISSVVQSGGLGGAAVLAPSAVLQ